MPTNKPTKPNITLPTAFGTSSSNVKTPFTAQELIDGYSASIPQVLDGGNLNYMVDSLFQFLTWSNTYADWYAGCPANKVPYVNSSNQLDYESPVFGGSNNTFTGTNTFNGNITSSGTNTFSGSNTFSNSVSLGSNATAITPSASDNSTKVATTAWFNLADVKKKLIHWCMPKYSSKTQIAEGSSGDYTPEKDGWIWIRAKNNNRTAKVSIGNYQVFQSDWSASYGVPDNSFIPVASGSKISWTCSSGDLDIWFFTCIGE